MLELHTLGHVLVVNMVKVDLLGHQLHVMHWLPCATAVFKLP